MSGMGGRSPPRGGAAVGAANQQFLAGSDEEADDDRQGGTDAEPQPDQKASKKRKVPFTLSIDVVVSTYHAKESLSLFLLFMQLLL